LILAVSQNGAGIRPFRENATQLAETGIPNSSQVCRAQETRWCGGRPPSPVFFSGGDGSAFGKSMPGRAYWSQDSPRLSGPRVAALSTLLCAWVGPGGPGREKLRDDARFGDGAPRTANRLSKGSVSKNDHNKHRDPTDCVVMDLHLKASPVDMENWSEAFQNRRLFLCLSAPINRSFL